MTAVAEKKATEADTTGRVARAINPECIWQQKAGSRWCQWDVCAPEGASFDDLLDPSVWKRVQETKRPAIRQGDEIRITAFDRSWVVWCFVAHATGNGIILSQFADTNPTGPRESLFEDSTYRVAFTGVGYSVVRKTDGQEMVHPVHSADAARTNLLQLYPQKVA